MTCPQKSLEEFETLHSSKTWEDDHIHLDEMDVRKFSIDVRVQRLLHELQTIVVDQPYNTWGKTKESWDGYTLLLRNGFQSGDRRKPVTDEFQKWFEEVYCPVFMMLLYGPEWRTIYDHFAQFKACTIKVTEHGETFYGKNIFHMHVDMKIGILEPRNFTQKHGARLLFSIVPGALEEDKDAKAPQFGTTVYPLWQPRVGFRNNHEFHKYMMSMYHEVGIENSGLPRPHYVIEDDLVYRATSGEVLINKSHADHKQCQPIHAEPNPCPDRYLFVFDFRNLIRKDASTGKILPSDEIPEEKIMAFMKPLADASSEAFARRLGDVQLKCDELMALAETFPAGCETLERLKGALRR